MGGQQRPSLLGTHRRELGGVNGARGSWRRPWLPVTAEHCPETSKFLRKKKKVSEPLQQHGFPVPSRSGLFGTQRRVGTNRPNFPPGEKLK